MLFDEEGSEEEHHPNDDETPIVNAPVKVKYISNAQRNRRVEHEHMVRDAQDRKRAREQSNLLDQYGV